MDFTAEPARTLKTIAGKSVKKSERTQVMTSTDKNQRAGCRSDTSGRCECTGAAALGQEAVLRAGACFYQDSNFRGITFCVGQGEKMIGCLGEYQR